MLRLTLVRHAKAEAARTGQEDFDRALDADGRREALEMGRRLQHHGMRPVSLCASPATRAANTATMLARQLGFAADAIVTDQRLYLISASDLLEWIHHGENLGEHLMIVAHNPGLSEFAARIAAAPSVTSLPTCGSYSLEFTTERWSELAWHSGIRERVDFPRGR